MATKNPFIKPYLKWAGGKRQLLPEIKKYIPKKFDTYFEPFVGAGAVLFSLQPKNAFINDSNSRLISTYVAIRDNADELIDLLQEHKRQNSEEYFYAVRGMDRDVQAFEKLNDVQKAARLIYLNKTCYNGLYRVNAQGLFNAPFGRYKNPAICEEPVLKAVSNYLSSNAIHITSGDFANALAAADTSSFVYFDSPYHSPDNTNFTGYQAGGFDEDEQIRLQQTFVALTGRGVKCLLSNSATPFILDLYKDFDIKIVEVSRAINSDANGRGKVSEVLVIGG